MERKSFTANEVFNFADKIVQQRNMEVFVGINHQATHPRVVAYAVCVTSNRRLLLHKICVSIEFRRRGIGSLLLETLIGDAKRRFCRGIDLWVDEANQAAKDLYSKHGFNVQEIVPDYYSPGRNGVKMSLVLV
jgi:ribosomal protein S18 acetylase RimI-like enzyme